MDYELNHFPTLKIQKKKLLKNERGWLGMAFCFFFFFFFFFFSVLGFNPMYKART
jgi:hypothetical protein